MQRCVKDVSCSAQFLSTGPGMLSGPAVLQGLNWNRTLLTLIGVIQGRGGVAFRAGVLFSAANYTQKSFRHVWGFKICDGLDSAQAQAPHISALPYTK